MDVGSTGLTARLLHGVHVLSNAWFREVDASPAEQAAERTWRGDAPVARARLSRDHGCHKGEQQSVVHSVHAACFCNSDKQGRAKAYSVTSV